MKKVYILLSKTGTLPARIIHLIDGGKFAHASISAEPRTDSFYSYGRRRLNNIFVAGMIAENTKTFVFERYKNGYCELYELDVPDEAYDKICDTINDYYEKYDLCKYNFFGVFLMLFGIKSELKYKMTCSQFVATVLHKSGAVVLPKHYSLMRPNDFMKIDGIRMIYSGTIGNCHFPD